MTNPAQPTVNGVRADIAAILAARKAASAASIPALPVSRPVPLPSGPVNTAKPVPLPTGPQPQGKPVPMPTFQAQSIQAPVPAVSDTDLTVFLAGHLPALIKASQDVVTGPFAFAEVLTLAQVVSQAVHDGLPLAKGAEAAQLVNVIAGYVWDKYAAPLLPDGVRPFAGLLRGLMLAGIEAAYRFGVKKVGR